MTYHRWLVQVRRSTRTTSSAYKSSAPTAPENTHAKVLRTRTATTGKVVSTTTTATSKGKAKAEPIVETKKAPVVKRNGLKDVTRIMANKEKAKKITSKDGGGGPSKPSSTTSNKVVSKRATRNTVITVLKDVKEESTEGLNRMHVDSELAHPPPQQRVAKRPSTDDIEVDAPSPKKRARIEAAEESQLEADQVQEALVAPSSEDLFEHEYDPHGNDWVDIDAEDGDDTAMVSEYVVETFQWLMETEVRLAMLVYSS